MDIQGIFEKQLAEDYSCSVTDVRSKEHIFTKKEYRPGRRIFRGDECLLKVVCVNGKLIVSTEEEILDWCRDAWKDASAAWFFDVENLRKLDEKLKTLGHKVGDCHHYYLPTGAEFMKETVDKGIEGVTLKWYEAEEIEWFRHNNSYPEALSFIAESPDVLAVAAWKNDVILGMAGASSDSDTMWQIGINVTKDGEGMGMGTFLVTNLKREILKRGIVPFYGTAESHIKSQKVGIQSGFLPAWAELYSAEISMPSHYN